MKKRYNKISGIDLPDEVFIEYAEVKNSPGAGEGVFAIKDISEGTIVAQYGGYRLDSDQDFLPPELAQPPELGKDYFAIFSIHCKYVLKNATFLRL